MRPRYLLPQQLAKGRERDDERILIHTTGLVSQDVALAHFLYRRALDKGLGLWLPSAHE